MTFEETIELAGKRPDGVGVVIVVEGVAIAPKIESVGVLAGIVLVRTFLSFSLEVEPEGSLPWRRRRGGSADSVDPGGPAR